MDDDAWLAGSDPDAMLAAVLPTASERRLRLFGCACCRRVWHLLRDRRSRQAVEAAERFADGLTFKEVLSCLAERAGAALRDDRTDLGDWDAAAAAASVAHGDIKAQIQRVMAEAASAPLNDFTVDSGAVIARENAALADLLRCVCGPFRRRSAHAFPAHLVGLAWECYEAFPPVAPQYVLLADALDDLDEPALAEHCRQPLHARGCHVLDGILGRE
jgi:hypothetical protein